jgi:hypothetical protein
MKTKRAFSWALFGGLTVFATLQGCSDDSDGNDKPPVIVKPNGGTKGNGDAGSDGNGDAGSPDTGGKNGTGGTGNNGGKNNNGGTGNTNTGNANTGGTEEPLGGAGAGGAPPEPECALPERGEDGCYNCPVKGEFEQWVNRCVDSDCVPFDNDRVTQLKSDGSLPPLPN